MYSISKNTRLSHLCKCTACNDQAVTVTAWPHPASSSLLAHSFDHGAHGGLLLLVEEVDFIKAYLFNYNNTVNLPIKKERNLAHTSTTN